MSRQHLLDPNGRIGSWPQRGLVGLVKAYRLLLSPWLGSACRFSPTCSAYALQALDRHGAATGSYLTLRRLARCHPGCAGGPDPVPTAVPRRANCAEPADQQSAPAHRSAPGRRKFSHLSPKADDVCRRPEGALNEKISP